MVLHFFNNFVILLLAYINPGESAVDYSKPWNVIYPILLVILTVGVVVGLLVLINYIIKKQNKKQIMIAETKNEEENNNTLDNKENIKDKIVLDLSQDLNGPDTKFYKNIYIIMAFVAGLLFWIFSVVSSFN